MNTELSQRDVKLLEASQLLVSGLFDTAKSLGLPHSELFLTDTAEYISRKSVNQ